MPPNASKSKLLVGVSEGLNAAKNGKLCSWRGP